MPARTPTNEAYSELQEAYDYFNGRLFDGALPACLLTLQRKSARVLGYFSPQRFDGLEGTKTDELAMNPMHFRARSIEDVLSTLAHEMAHVWQAHHGKPGRGGYHNKEWGQKMKEIGLYPSNTGKPGGKETGDQMTHFIIEGGRFEVVARSLLARGFRLSWAEGTGSVQPVGKGGEGDGEGEGEGEGGRKPIDRSNRVKYTCPGCATNAWGKPRIKLLCGDCMVRLEPA